LTEQEKKRISKLMSLSLRHQPEAIGIDLDEHGWTKTTELIAGLNRAGYQITVDELKEVVATNDKQRFKFSDDEQFIRANQGHSIKVDVQLSECQPPAILYHGTVSKYIQSIKEKGLIPKGRLYVHLSEEKETAYSVGSRRGQPIILTINAQKMHDDGIKFYKSENDVWLTEAIPTEYIWNFPNH